jgi:hypothetical protein
MGLHWLRVMPVQGVDPGLLASARDALKVKRSLSVRRSITRRH